MPQYILKSNDQVVPRKTVKHIPPKVQTTTKMQEYTKHFDTSIYTEMEDSLTAREVKKEDMDLTPYEDDKETSCLFTEDKDILFKFVNASLTEGLIKSDVLLYWGKDADGSVGSKVKAKVVCHLMDENGDIIGQPNEDLNLNNVMYEVEFSDGTRMPIAANTIAQEIYSQVNADGRRGAVVLNFIDYCWDPKYMYIQYQNLNNTFITIIKDIRGNLPQTGKYCQGWKINLKCR